MTVRIARSVAELRARGRATILEHEGLDLADTLGLGTPLRFRVRTADEVPAGRVESWACGRAIVKVLSPRIVHRSRVGALREVEPTSDAVCAAVTDLAARFGGGDVAYLVEAWLDPGGTGGELLLAVRDTEAWGPVVVVAPGGVGAEVLAGAWTDAAGPWMARRSPAGWRRPFVDGALGGDPDPGAALEALDRVVATLLHAAPTVVEAGLVDLEFNPVRWVGGRWTALDALGHLRAPDEDEAAPAAGAGVDPQRVWALLHPRTVAVVGASARGRNPGRIILDNLVEMGFPPEAVQVVKPGVETLAGCRCVSDVTRLEPVDLLAVAVAAQPAEEVLRAVVERGLARGVVLVPGGMPSSAVAPLLREARGAGDAPVVVGPNCLGLRSVPGRIDTLFLPRDRVRFAGRPPAPVALVSQSGAFALTRLARHPELDLRYVVTLGNQADVTLGRVAQALALDPELRATAWYVEGFAPGDGARWLDALSAGVEAGRSAVVYAGGRTPAGRDAAASHTAAVASDARVLRELCREAGVSVVDTLTAFEDALGLLSAWGDRAVAGPRLGVMSNAGFETVAAADGVGELLVPELGSATVERLDRALHAAGVGAFVPVVHPLDVTPMLGDAAFVEVAAAILDDPGVDVGVIGCVPLTPALDTPLAEAAGRPDAKGTDVTSRLAELWQATSKPWLVVVDAGPGHQWMRSRLARAGVPVLSSMDRVGPAVRAVLGPGIEKPGPGGRFPG